MRQIKFGFKGALICFVLIAVLIVTTFFSFMPTKAYAMDSGSGVNELYEVTASSLNVRSFPNTNCKVLGSYQRGSKVTGEMLTSNWLKISYNGKTAYLSGDYLRLVKSSNTDKSSSATKDISSDVRYKTTSGLNVRKGPDTSYAKIGLLSCNQVINPVGITDNNWYKINYNGQMGYVCGDYVTTYTPILNSDGFTDDPADYIIVINSRNCTLNVYYQNSLWHEFSCATGKSSTPTPQGCFSVANKYVNPAWKNIAGGASNNPLGKRWMGLSVPGTGGGTYGIHGNSNEDSIGTHASAGCVRMHNDEVEELYPIIPIGTTVIIQDTDDDDITIAANYGFTLTR